MNIANIMLQGQSVEQVNNLCFSGCIITTNGGSEMLERTADKYNQYEEESNQACMCEINSVLKWHLVNIEYSRTETTSILLQMTENSMQGILA